MATARIHLATGKSARWTPSELPEIQELAAEGKLETGTVVELDDGTKYRYTAPRAAAWRKLRAPKADVPDAPKGKK